MTQYLTQLISYVVGKVAEITIPSALRPTLYRFVTQALKINLSESATPVERFSSVQELFIRELKPEARPLPDGGNLILSPCDGTLRSYGGITDHTCLLVKERPQSIAELLSCERTAPAFEGGSFVNLYLSPKDYHRVHTPVAGTVTQIRVVPGKLLPVADWSIDRWPTLFAENERWVFEIQTQYGMVAVLMVGALNVGNIQSSVEAGQTIQAGAELGIFRLGSSVILLFPKSFALQFHGAKNRAVKLREAIASIRGNH